MWSKKNQRTNVVIFNFNQTQGLFSVEMGKGVGQIEFW